MKRKLNFNILSALFVMCLTFTFQSTGTAQAPPNLLFIMTDQQRFDATSCAGNTVLETQNMDRIAREGELYSGRNQRPYTPVKLDYNYDMADRNTDDKIGEIFNKLDELGLAENTLVIFNSDHGEMLGDHGMHSKSIFYEGGVHVPLGMPVPSCDGISLRTFIEGHPVDHNVVSYSPGNRTPNYMIRKGDLKFMVAGNENNPSIASLYDLKADPLEMRNLIVSPVSQEKNHQQAQMMKERLVKWMEKHEPHKAEGLKLLELF